MGISNASKAGEKGRVTVSFSGSLNLIRDQVQWTPKGVSLLTKCFFEEGTEVEFAFDHDGERHCCVGIIVACHPLSQPRGCFSTVLFFVETPCSKLQKAACDCRLSPENHPSTTQLKSAMNNGAPAQAGSSSRRTRSAQARNNAKAG
jgi:hypothetical protein